MSGLSCPRCRSKKCDNPSLKLMVNVCGHPLCESCVQVVFSKGQGDCATCHISLSKHLFRFQQYESAEVERYVEVRKKINKIYNKFSTDFKTLREYNDYLEEVETVAYNLTHKIDEEETNKKVEEYRRKNGGQIQKNSNKKSPEEEELDMLIEEDQLRRQNLDHKKIAEEKVKLEMQKKKNNILNDFMYSNLPLNEFIKKEEELKVEEVKVKIEEEKVSKFSSGIFIGKRENIIAAPRVKSAKVIMNAEDVKYKPLVREEGGLPVPEEEELMRLGYLSKVRQVNLKEDGCGFRAVTMCERALSDAYDGLFIYPS